jgi:DNA-binding transcriptional ArsR family regulator
MVRKWADQQPAKYRNTALAFGYRCDRKSHSFSGTLAWISRKSRERKGEGVSRPTLVRHLPVFEKYGVITVERRRDGDKNMSSVYHVYFDRFIGSEDPAYDGYLTSLAAMEQPEKPSYPLSGYSGHSVLTCQCDDCRGYVQAYRGVHSRGL